MKERNEVTRKKGGRPSKIIKRNCVVPMKCANYEKVLISANARKARLSVSEFLREMGLNGQIVLKEKVLPREVLELTGTLNHMAANLNQIAKKRNSVVDELNAAERARLKTLSDDVKEIAQLIRSYLL